MILLSMESVQLFLESEMKKRGWKQADLARYSGLDPSLINNYITGKRNIGLNSVVAIAKAFGVRPDVVCRGVGLFPPLPLHTEQHEKLLYLFDQLEDKDQKTVLDLMNFLLSK